MMHAITATSFITPSVALTKYHDSYRILYAVK
jgi:hypothetical protein